MSCQIRLFAVLDNLIWPFITMNYVLGIKPFLS